MEEFLIFLGAVIFLRLTYRLIKGIQNSKIHRRYPKLNQGDRVIYREMDESGIRKTPATVVWQKGPLVRIKPDDEDKITVERVDLKIENQKTKNHE